MIHAGYEISDFFISWQQCAHFPKTICRMCVTIYWRFCPDEGAVAGYGNWIRAKYTAKWGVQIAGMIFQTRSSAKVRSNSRQKHFSFCRLFFYFYPLFFSSFCELLCSFFHISPILSYINVNFSRIFILALKFYKFFSIIISIWVSQWDSFESIIRCWTSFEQQL